MKVDWSYIIMVPLTTFLLGIWASHKFDSHCHDTSHNKILEREEYGLEMFDKAWEKGAMCGVHYTASKLGFSKHPDLTMGQLLNGVKNERVETEIEVEMTMWE